MSLEFWNKVSKTDPNYTKKADYGRKFTSICAQYQIMIATEQWGMFGKTWGVKGEKYERYDNVILYTAQLYYPGYTEGILLHSDIEIIFSSGNRKGKYNEDWSKKVATDALTKGLSKLGFNADVFLGKFDDNKYIQQQSQKVNKKKNNIFEQKQTNNINEMPEVNQALYKNIMALLREPDIFTMKEKTDNKKKADALKLKIDELKNFYSTLNKIVQKRKSK